MQRWYIEPDVCGDCVMWQREVSIRSGTQPRRNITAAVLLHLSDAYSIPISLALCEYYAISLKSVGYVLNLKGMEIRGCIFLENVIDCENI